MKEVSLIMPYTAEIIEKLKVVKRERGLSVQDIADMTEDAGCAVSLTTIKRVFAENSDAREFKYEKTIKPIVKVLLGLSKDVEPPTDNATQAEALRSVVALKDEMIKTLNKQIDLMGTEYQERVADLKRRQDRSDRIIRALSISLAVAVAAVIAALVF